jgi:hypothetical protein
VVCNIPIFFMCQHDSVVKKYIEPVQTVSPGNSLLSDCAMACVAMEL